MLVSNVFYFHPENWGNDPIWRAYFSNGLKPPTSDFILAKFHFFWWYFEGFEGFVTFVKRCLIHFWFWFLTNLGVWCSCLLSTTKVCVFEFCTTTTRDPTKGTSSNSLSATLTSHFGALEGKDRIKFRVLRFDTMAPGLPRVSSQRRGFQPANLWQSPYHPQPSHGESSGPPGMTAVHQDRPKLPSGNPAAGSSGKKRKPGMWWCSQGILQKIAAMLYPEP